MTALIFLKLGGSLITDKSRPYVPRLDKLADLCSQIAEFRGQNGAGSHEGARLLLGHGSGSFGHTAARQHGTRQGVHEQTGWRGFTEVHFRAAALNNYVMEALHQAGIPALAFPPSASVIARGRQVVSWELAPLRRALEAGVLPVIYGDVVFDEELGGTILSTEDLFRALAGPLSPARILLAGLESGVWRDFPARAHLMEQITPNSYHSVRAGVGQARGADVTGGMQAKVEEMLELVQSVRGLEVLIFSAEEPGSLLQALQGGALGTRICL